MIFFVDRLRYAWIGPYIGFHFAAVDTGMASEIDHYGFCRSFGRRPIPLRNRNKGRTLWDVRTGWRICVATLLLQGWLHGA